jgi:hypothetical protein
MASQLALVLEPHANKAVKARRTRTPEERTMGAIRRISANGALTRYKCGGGYRIIRRAADYNGR